MLRLQVQLETTDTVQVKLVEALLDSGVTGCFIDRDYMRKNGLNTYLLSQPIPVFNVDGSQNDARSIMEVVDIILHYKSHSECTTLAVTMLG